MLRAPGVLLINPKFPHNLGATIRACSCFGLDSLVWTGSRIQVSQYERLPREERMKGYKSVRFVNHERPFDLFADFTPVCVEVYEQSEPLTTFEHPEGAVYVFGPEDGRVPQVIRRMCHRFVHHSRALLFELECSGECGVGASTDVAANGGTGAITAAPSNASRGAWRGSHASDGCSRLGR